MSVKQGGLCGICRKPETVKLNKWGLAVDHCHQTGRVRGLLCQRCNAAIGLMFENAETMRAAARYIEKHNAELKAQ